ncbi:MAG: helix-turn-helix transcriptional regulator [Chloroflexota bacterium]|nr:helix-turn-helix transcriptional regulator [Chloroflexota bacterium]
MNERRAYNDEEPCFVISVAARMVGMHAQSLRNYERMGLIQPGRSQGRVRLYSQVDIERLRNIQRMVQDLGVNLAGVDVIMNMRETMQRMEREMALLREELQAYRDRTLPAVSGRETGSPR